MKQGYNDRIDDSLGNRDGKKSSKEQSYKDRRDEAKAMNKAEGKRAYQSVDTMDKKSFDEIWSKFKADTKKAFGGDKYAKGGGIERFDFGYVAPRQKTIKGAKYNIFSHPKNMTFTNEEKLDVTKKLKNKGFEVKSRNIAPYGSKEKMWQLLVKKEYAKGGGVDDTYKKMIEAKGKQFVFERILKDSQFYQTNEMDKDDFIYDKNGRDVRAYPSNEKIDLYINWRSSNSSQKVTFSQPSELAEYLDNNQIYAKGGGVGESDDCPEYFMEVEGDTQKAYELLKKARWFDETSTRVYNDLEDIKGFVSNDKESLSRAETYLDSKGISTSVIYNLKEKFWADLDEEGTGDQNWVWNTMYFAIRDRIDPEYDINTMSLVETANENALNSGLIYTIEELGKRPLYKEISATALKNIRRFWGENIKEIYLSKIPKYIKSEMPKGTPTDEDAERIADKGAAMFYGEFEKKFKEYLNYMEGGYAKGYAKGGKIFNLEPVDSRKSFYGKAKGINLGNTTQLQSYDTIVAEYDNVNKKMTINDYYSPTTARHINAFLDYYGYPTMSKSEMLSVKGTKFEKGGAISSNYFSGMLSFLNY